MIGRNAVILFAGDSITDAGRNRELAQPSERVALGNGFACLLAAQLLDEHVEKHLKIYNRGIGGNTIRKMAERWQADCLDLAPDLLSILIGVNDTDCPTPEFDACYRRLLDQARSLNPELHLVLCEPFRVVVQDEQHRWIDGLRERREIARNIAADYEACWVPFQAAFDDMIEQAPAASWIPDGVHPSLGGHHRMAGRWLEAVDL